MTFKKFYYNKTPVTIKLNNDCRNEKVLSSTNSDLFHLDSFSKFHENVISRKLEIVNLFSI